MPNDYQSVSLRLKEVILTLNSINKIITKWKQDMVLVSGKPVEAHKLLDGFDAPVNDLWLAAKNLDMYQEEEKARRKSEK